MTTGRCLCGAVTFSISADRITGRACWCRVCQYVGAGSATVNSVFPSAAVTVEGEMRDYISIADSGSRMHRRFCPVCGTHLFSASEATPHLVVVRVGALDSPQAFPPVGTIWTKSAPDWACFDPALPQIEGQPLAPVKPSSG
jgi:hypothetical protein